ncbi:MAG TPA: serpin family protein, partial [Terriglobia bacterium]|nr:serpin family protein [Terriglobia bacterium]
MRKISLWVFAVAALPAILMFAAAQNNSPRPPAGPADTKWVEGGNRFGLQLFSQLRQKDSSGNVFLSPLSIFTALNMAYAGAGGETEREMARVLHLDGLSRDDAAGASLSVKNRMKSADPKVELLIANSLWARRGMQFNEA